jgi:hypothetical protein
MADSQEKDMNMIDGCAECGRLSTAYEAATMSWFRLEGNLRIAQYGRDENSSQELAAELAAVTEQRLRLRAASELHRTEKHSQAARMNG